MNRQATSAIGLFVTLLFLLVSVPPSHAQEKASNNLVLTGSVANVQAYCYKGRRPMAWLDLVMQFRNDSDEPVIIIQPNLIFDRKAYLSSSPDNTHSIAVETLVYNPYLADPFSTVIRQEDYDYRPALFGELPKRRKVIEPGGFYEFRTDLLVTSGFKFDARFEKAQPSECKDAAAPIPEHQFLFVEYRLSGKKAPSENADFFRELADRWKTFGRLVLDSRGDIVYKSQMIILPRN